MGPLGSGRRAPLDHAKIAAFLGSDTVTDVQTGKPAVTWNVVVRRFRRTTEAEEERKDTYDSFQAAKDFAREWVEYHGYYDAKVINSKGVTVYEARRDGVRYNPKLGGKRRRK